jgi:hypothetical protein
MIPLQLRLLPGLPCPEEGRARTVVGGFGRRREETAGQLIVAPVVGDAFAAQPLALARLIRTGAGAKVGIVTACPIHPPPS